MPITVVARPVTLDWGNFAVVNSLAHGEDAHINPGYELQNRPLRRVGRDFMLAETLEIRVQPQARVLRTANRTADLLAHEQGHYDIGILAARALARDLASLQAGSPRALAQAADAAFTLHTQTRLGPIQRAYDHDTDHSRNTTEQQRWEKMIGAALALGSATELNQLPL